MHRRRTNYITFLSGGLNQVGEDVLVWAQMGTWRKKVTVTVAWLFGILALSMNSAPADECGPKPYDSALSHLQQQEFDPAIDCLAELLKADPQDLKAINLLGI